MIIRDLRAHETRLIDQVAALLIEGFREMAPDAWPTLESARAEIRESFAPGRISRVALDDDGAAVGWIGGIRQYDGAVYELHPLVVDPAQQGHGIGRALVIDLEEQVRARGGIMITLGSDDEMGLTSLGGVDLFPNVLGHLARIQNLRRHPYEFYQKLGYEIIGVIPDANGIGKPDILMAKSLRR
jgi:aminoglycoside 6'-N-acetyltransferase I